MAGVASLWKILVAVSTAAAVLYAIASHGLWLWASKHSWVNAYAYQSGSFDMSRAFCLDFQFGPQISGSMVKVFKRTERQMGYFLEHGPALILAQGENAIGFDGLPPGLDVLPPDADVHTQIEDFEHADYFEIEDQIPILNHLPDMNVLNKKGARIATVSFTLNPVSWRTLGLHLAADFKSVNSTDVDHMAFRISEKNSVDARCVLMSQ